MLRTALLLKFLMWFIFFQSTICFAQINPLTNGFDDYYEKNIISDNYPKNSNIENDTTTSCTANTFFGVSNNGMIQQFTIYNGIVTPGNTFTTICPGRSLAICNNLNGGVVSPTFYTSTAVNLSDSIFYYDSNFSWQSIPVTSTHKLANSGGYGNYLFFQENSGNPSPQHNQIIRYDGN